MATYGVSIEKDIPWRGGFERISNVYHYSSTGLVDVVGADGLLAQLLDAEQKVHGTAVAFKQGRVWSAGGTPQENETILIKDFASQGVKGFGVELHKEAAVVVKWYLGRKSSTGRRVYLRKHLHPGVLTSTSIGSAVGTSKLAATDITNFTEYGNAVKNIEALGVLPDMTLCAPDGTKIPLGTNPEILEWITHRQFRRH